MENRLQSGKRKKNRPLSRRQFLEPLSLQLLRGCALARSKHGSQLINWVVSYKRQVCGSFGLYGDLRKRVCLFRTRYSPGCHWRYHFSDLLGVRLCLGVGHDGSQRPLFIGRYFGRDFAASLIGDKLRKYDDGIERNGFATVLYLRLVYFPFTILNFGMGLTKVHFWDYFFATGLVIIAATFIFIFFIGAIK